MSRHRNAITVVTGELIWLARSVKLVTSVVRFVRIITTFVEAVAHLVHRNTPPVAASELVLRATIAVSLITIIVTVGSVVAPSLEWNALAVIASKFIVQTFCTVAFVGPVGALWCSIANVIARNASVVRLAMEL